MTQNLNPHQNIEMIQFLIRCAQYSHLSTTGTLEEPAFLKTEEDWNQFFNFARSMSLLLPCCVALNKASWKSGLPESAEKKLQATLKDELITMAVLENEFENVLHRLIESKVTAIILAGSVLQRDTPAEEAYKSVRNFDVLVPREQITGTLRTIGRIGYRLQEVDSRYGGQTFSRRLQSAVSGENLMSRLRFRWRILENDPEHDAAALWERTAVLRSTEFPQGLRGLAVEDKLVQLIRHGIEEDLFTTPAILNELDQWIRTHSDLDWIRVLFMLERSKSVSAGAFALHILKKHWDTPVPKKVLDSIGAQIGTFKRRTLQSSMDLSAWFSDEERDLSLALKAVYLFHDHSISDLKNSLQQIRQIKVA